jgi:O-antigen ligase
MELRKISDKYQQIISLTNYLLVLTVAFSAAFPNRIFNILWVAWLATWLLEGRFLKKSNFSFDKSKIIILMLAGFYVWEAVSILWAEDKKAGFSVLERQMSFLAIVPVALFGVNRYYKTSTILASLVVGVLVSVLSYSMTLLYANNVEYFQNSGDKAFWKGFNAENFSIWISFIKHRLYYNTILVVAIFSLPFLYKKYASRYGKYLTAVIILVAAVAMLAMLYFTGSRSMILALILIMAVAVWRYIDKKHRLWVSLSAFMIVAIGVFVFVEYHPRMKNFKSDDFEALRTGKTDNELIEPRLLIWHAVFENPSDYIAYGLGAGNSTDYLVEKHKANNFPERFVTRKYSAHNQYFAAMMELGLAGALYLIAFFFLYHRFLTGNARRFAFYFSLLIAFNLLTEAMLGRGDGVLTLSFFSLMCIWMEKEQKANSELPEYL